MQPKLQRWIDLLAALLRRSYPARLDELARDIPAYRRSVQQSETRRRMFERDKRELRSFGIAIETKDIGDGELGYLLARADFYLPFLQLINDGRRSAPARSDRFGYRSLPRLAFEPEELSAVALAARRVKALGVPSLTADADAALRKLGYDLPASMENAADGIYHAEQGPRVGAEVFECLADCLRQKKRVTLRYHSLDRDEVASRTLEPYGLFFLGHHWYLAAASPDDPTVKNFRLSRVRDVAPASSHAGPEFELPKGFSLQAHAHAKHAWELGTWETTEAVIRVVSTTGAALSAARLGIPDPEDGSLRRFQVRQLDTFARWILGAGGALVPVSPAHLVDLVRDSLVKMRALYP